MTILEFPPLDTADEHGLLAVGGDLEVDSLLLAYRNGIFPWPISEEYLTWFAPPRRAILPCSDFHVPRSLRKSRNQGWASFSIDTAFEEVITSCQELVNRSDQNGTWITEEVKQAFIALHHAGHAHSIECYREGVLVGGLYGMHVDGVFAAESMFYRYPDASKLVLWFLIDYMQVQEVPWIDVQILSPFLVRFGAVEISRDEFTERLRKEFALKRQLFEDVESASLQQLLPDWRIAEVGHNH